jgi:hypothetical protein
VTQFLVEEAVFERLHMMDTFHRSVTSTAAAEEDEQMAKARAFAAGGEA